MRMKSVLHNSIPMFFLKKFYPVRIWNWYSAPEADPMAAATAIRRRGKKLTTILYCRKFYIFNILKVAK
jgi:hypothetical protein